MRAELHPRRIPKALSMQPTSAPPPNPSLDPSLDERRKAIALFRYGLIADLAHLEPRTRGLYARLREKAAREYDIPGSLRRHVAEETLRGWLRDYREGGFDALLPRVRADQGASRSIPAAVIDVLCEFKEEDPSLSVPALIRRAREKKAAIVHADIVLPESTVHRVLARRGLTKKTKGDPSSNDRRRFEHADAGDLWMSDVMHGPKVRDGKRSRRTYLIAIIDDATRLVPHAAFALSEGTTSYLAVFEHAIRRRGLPKRLYVDNGSAFRSKQLELVCAKLGIVLIHAKPYSPQGKGKMERWFRTVRMQFLPLLDDDKLASLDAMNRALGAWVEGEYHEAAHSGLHGESPSDKWARSSEGLRPAPSDLRNHFLAEQRRRVGKDRTVTLDGVAFEVDASLVGERVALRYEAARAPDKRTLQVVHNGKLIETARKVDVLANCYVRRNNGKSLVVTEPKPEPMTAAACRDLDPAEGIPMRELVEDGDDDASALELMEIF